MFDNIDNKLKNVASALTIIGIILSSVGFIALLKIGIDEEDFTFIGIAFLVLIIGILTSYTVSLFIYGFGELISRTTSIDRKINNTVAKDTNDNNEHFSNREEINTIPKLQINENGQKTVKLKRHFIEPGHEFEAYNNAMNLLNKGYYTAAAEIFFSLGNYKDSGEYLQKTIKLLYKL